MYSFSTYLHSNTQTYICIESESEIGSCVLSYTWQQKLRTIARTRLKQEQSKKEKEQEHEKEHEEEQTESKKENNNNNKKKKMALGKLS